MDTLDTLNIQQLNETYKTLSPKERIIKLYEDFNDILYNSATSI